MLYTIYLLINVLCHLTIDCDYGFAMLLSPADKYRRVLQVPNAGVLSHQNYVIKQKSP